MSVQEKIDDDRIANAGQTESWLISARRWWLMHVAGNVDHRAVVNSVQAEAEWSGHYAFMTLMSAGIAVLGLLLSSPAVVIGAMLISPLMGPIIGLGFALALFDFEGIRRRLVVLAIGVVLAVGLTALIVLLSPLQTVTPEIAARTRPNLFDLLVALFSAMAGAYAMIRGRQGTIVGVAIATALMPPLAVVGFGLATWNGTVFGGALLLFFTNLMTIAVTAAVMARLYGFGTYLSPDQTRLQAVVMVGSMVLLAVPLALTLRQIGWEAVTARQARDIIARQFPQNAQISDVRLDFAAKPLSLSANVLTPRLNADADGRVDDALEDLIDRDVTVALRQVRVSTVGEAQAAELAAARANEEQTALRQDIAMMSARLALAAGVTRDEITVDVERHRAEVRARSLPGATLATYQALELRIREAAPGWDIRLIPPLTSLPEVTPAGDGRPDPAALSTTIWAAQRTGVSIVVAARDAEFAEQVVDAIVKRGGRARAISEAAATAGAVLRWDVAP